MQSVTRSELMLANMCAMQHSQHKEYNMANHPQAANPNGVTTIILDNSDEEDINNHHRMPNIIQPKSDFRRKGKAKVCFEWLNLYSYIFSHIATFPEM